MTQGLEELVRYALEGRQPAAALFEAQWQALPDVRVWLQEANSLLRAAGDVFAARERFVTWLLASARASDSVDHEAVIACEVVELELVARDDGGFADAQALYAKAARPEIAGLVVKGAFATANYEAAEAFSRLAGDRRSLAGALLHQRRWHDAFDLLDEVLSEPGPLFGGQGVSVSAPSNDKRSATLDEARIVISWASADTAEWVRALGGLWEVFATDSIEAELERRFMLGLRALSSIDDFETVIRQARERQFLRAAMMASKVGCERFPTDSLVHSLHGNLLRDAGQWAAASLAYRRSAELLDEAGSESRASGWMTAADALAAAGDHVGAEAAFARARTLITPAEQTQLEFFVARSLKEREPEAARTRVLALVEHCATEPRLLAESEVGIASVELALELLLAVHDRRALAVQHKLIDAKLALWGECPSVWLERHNLGTVHARLGEPDVARTLVSASRARFITEFGNDHPHVQLCERTLARIEQGGTA
jgi:tetratricopeptide (TPR) repeat protein